MGKSQGEIGTGRGRGGQEGTDAAEGQPGRLHNLTLRPSSEPEQPSVGWRDFLSGAVTTGAVLRGHSGARAGTQSLTHPEDAVISPGLNATGQSSTALRQEKGWEGGSESLGQARIPAGPPDSGSPELGLPQGLPGLYVRSAQQVGSPSRAGPCLTCLYPQVGPHLHSWCSGGAHRLWAGPCLTKPSSISPCRVTLGKLLNLSGLGFLFYENRHCHTCISTLPQGWTGQGGRRACSPSGQGRSP